MKNIFYPLLLFVFLFAFNNSFAQNYKISGAGTAGVNGIYVENGTHGSDNRPKYDHVDGTFFIYHDFYTAGGQSFWEIDNDLDDEGNVYYFWLTPNPSQTTMPIGSSWSSSGTLGSGTATSSQLPTIPNISFSNGSAFSPSDGTPGSNNNLIGRFQLTGSAEGGVLEAVTVDLSGTRNNVTNVKLWASSDNTFNSGSDKLLSTKADGSSVTFDTFYSLIDNTAGTYYFLTMDLAGGATGSVTATIPSQASFTFAGANTPSAFTNAPLSSAPVPLPVELNGFSAAQKGNAVVLKWTTETELNNYGFDIERQAATEEWIKLGFINGSGNSSSIKNYSFADNSSLTSGTYHYRLKQINTDGSFEYSQPVEVSFLSQPLENGLMQNYPNPFNPATIISYQLSAPSNVTLKVYDVLGASIATLVNKQQDAGVYHVNFDAAEFNLPGGIYLYKLTAGNYSAVKKLLLLK